MDKNIIKARLRILSEEVTPGIAVTAAAIKKSGTINKDGVKDIEKNLGTYEKALKPNKVNADTTKKTNYTDKFQKTYHDEMEIMNGQEMLQYDSKPDEKFVKRTKEAIEGSSEMGNENKIGNAEAAWGASSDEFGKDFVKRVKSSANKRSEQTPTLNLRGKDIQADLKDTGHRPYAIEENNNNPQINKTMKRLKFKNEFNGGNLTQKLGHALSLIPESYKVDNKEFEMTDGNLKCKIRWEGTLSEGAAVVLVASDKTLVNEDIERMKRLFGYKSQDTLGLVKGKSRLDENKVFNDILNKTKQLFNESEEIEGQTAEKEAPFEEADVNQAPEAKAHIEGSTSDDKGTVAPKPKEGNWEEIAVNHAPEAKAHIEGSTSDDKGTVAPKPKEGNLEDIKKKATEATKDIVNESEMEEEIEEGLDAFNNADEDEDDAEGESPVADVPAEEPVANDGDDDADDMGGEEVATANVDVLFSPSKGEYWLKNGEELTKISDEFVSIASDESKSGSERANLIIQQMEGGEEETPELGMGDESGDELGEGGMPTPAPAQCINK